MNAVIYARYSSHNQREESIEGQLKVCYEFAERNGYTIVGEYIDRALSGTNDNRPDFLRMIDDSSKKAFDYVIVYQLDRFARNRYDSAIYKSRLKKNGVRVLSARENITDDASGILVEGLLEAMAEYYSAELSQKIKRGMNINAEKCLSNGSYAPLGYKIKDGHYIIDDETAHIVLKIYEMYANGERVIDICNHLNAQGYKSSKGAPFNKNSLRNILKNKKYIGTYTFGDIEVPDGMPRIVPDDLFYKVQEILAKNKTAPAHNKAKAEYLLTTKLFCGKCKDMMVGISGKGKCGVTYRYYVCKNARKKVCNKKKIQKEYIENLIIDECRKMLTDENICKIASNIVALCESEKDNTAINRLQKLIKDNERKQRNLMNAVAECEIESVRKQLYEEISTLAQEKDALVTELNAQQDMVLSVNEKEIMFFLYEIKNGNADDILYKKALINTFINKVYLYDDKLTIFFNTNDSPVEIDDTLLQNIESEEFVYETNSSTIAGKYKLFFYIGGFALTVCIKNS